MLETEEREALIAEAASALAEMEGQQSAAFHMLGHKGDLMLVHFRPDFPALLEAQTKISKLPLSDYLMESTSYLSSVELGLYESTLKIYTELAEKGVEPHSEEWNKVIKDNMDRQAEAMQPRLYPEVPPHQFICFYPMDRLRGEQKNWYTLPMEERRRQMAEHGMVGRRYAGQVKQIISGSIGFDDWEWGVDLFANDPMVFKRLIYEMRWDEVSAVYAQFGEFFVGQRLNADGLKKLLTL